MQAIVDFLPAKVISFKGQHMEPGRDLETIKQFHRVLRRSLRPPVYSVFCAIEDHAGTTPPDGLPPFTCFASDKTLADEASVSRETVIRAIKELETLKLITVEDRLGYTSLIWPVVTNQGYLTFMQEQAKRDLLKKDTCNTKPQGVCHKATGGVSQSHTNETKLKKPNNETNKSMAVSSEPGPATIDLPDCLPPVNNTQVLLPTVEAATPGPVAPNMQDRGGLEASSHIPHSANTAKKPRKSKPENPYTKDPRLLKWREIALEEDYTYWPSKQAQKLVIDHIPLNQLSRWEATIRGWLRKNHKVVNVEGMVKVFWFGFDAFYKGQADNLPLPLVNQAQEGVNTYANT